MTVFNANNTEWVNGTYSLFMGQEPGLYDSINVNYPKLFDAYKQQISQRWVETEFNHEQSRLDLLNCSKNIYDVMLLNLSFQWCLDSVASRAIAPLFAPFVTCSEFWASLMENSNMEIVHALTYSDIVRQCVPNPKEVFDLVAKNEHILGRAERTVKVFDDLERVGAEYKLGLRGKTQDTYNYVFKGLVALYVLERLQFMSSFAATFAIIEQGYFQSIGKAIQKIMLDEIECHVLTDKTALGIELRTERGREALRQCRDEIQDIVDEAVLQEFKFNKYLYSQGRSIVGLNELLHNDWGLFNANFVYLDLGLPNPFPVIEKNPLKFMGNWLNIDKFQHANQESDNNNYALNTVRDDLGEEELEF